MMKEEKNFKGKRMLARAHSINTSWAFKEFINLNKESLILLDNVQFVYELALAQLELQSLGRFILLINCLFKSNTSLMQVIKIYTRKRLY